MKYSKEYIEELYSKQSLRQLSETLGLSVYKVLKLLKELNISVRDKSKAQTLNLSNGGPHPTKGKKLSSETKDKISKATEQFWKSRKGNKVKKIISKTRKTEWTDKTVIEKRNTLHALNHGERSHLSRFGDVFYKFLISKNIDVKKRVAIRNIVFDLLIDKTIIEFVGSMSSNKDYLDEKINSAISGGMDILIAVQSNSSCSQARCRRLFQEYETFIKSNVKSRIIYI